MQLLADDLRTAPAALRPFRPDPFQPGAVADLRAALHDEGLNAVPVPLAHRAEPELREALDLPAALTLEAVLAARPRR